MFVIYTTSIANLSLSLSLSLSLLFPTTKNANLSPSFRKLSILFEQTHFHLYTRSLKYHTPGPLYEAIHVATLILSTGRNILLTKPLIILAQISISLLSNLYTLFKTVSFYLSIFNFVHMFLNVYLIILGWFGGGGYFLFFFRS